MYGNMCVCEHVHICNIYVIYLLSSPYLRVFGDDRVRVTREQMLLMQVAQVKLSCGEGFDLGNFMILYFFWNSCKPMMGDFVILFFNFGTDGLWTFYAHLIKFNFSRILGKWGIIKCAEYFIFLYFIYKPVISCRDVTFGIRAMVFKMIFGSCGEWAYRVTFAWLTVCVIILLLDMKS